MTDDRDRFLDVEATLDTDTGEVHLIITDDGESVLDNTYKLRGKNPKKDLSIRFSIDNHPVTGKKESFKAMIYRRRARLWYMHIYPKYGKGIITRHQVSINKTGNNEYFER